MAAACAAGPRRPSGLVIGRGPRHDAVPHQRGPMGVEEPVPVHSQGRVTPIRAAPPPPPDPFELAERALRTAIGLASLVAGSLTSAIAEAIGGEAREPADEQPDDGEPWPRPLVPILAGAALGVAIQSARAGTRAASAFGRSLRPWISFAKSPTFVRERLGRVRDRIDALDDQWREEQQEDERIGQSFVVAILPQIVDADPRSARPHRDRPVPRRSRPGRGHRRPGARDLPRRHRGDRRSPRPRRHRRAVSTSRRSSSASTSMRSWRGST